MPLLERRAAATVTLLAALACGDAAFAHEPRLGPKRSRGGPDAPLGERFELSPMLGFQFGGQFSDVGADDDRVSLQDVAIDDSVSYGLTADIYLGPETRLALSYSRQPTEIDAAELPEEFAGTSGGIDLDIDYYHLGGVYEWSAKETRGRPFVFSSLGLTRFVPGGGFESDSRFSLGFGGGGKFPVSERVGIRVQGQLLFTFVDSDGQVFCQGGGSGARCLVFVESGSLYQIGLSIGLDFGF